MNNIHCQKVLQLGGKGINLIKLSRSMDFIVKQHLNIVKSTKMVWLCSQLINRCICV